MYIIYMYTIINKQTGMYLHVWHIHVHACIQSTVFILSLPLIALYRKESLRVLRKMCRYMTKEWLVELCDEVPADPQRAPFTASISEVLAVVFDNEVSAAPLITP